MPYIITYLWFPPHLSEDVAQRYIETLKKYPLISIINRVIPGAIKSEKEEIEAMTIDEVKTKDLGEALNYVSKFVVEYRHVKGVRYQIRVANTLSEAMTLVGIE